MRAKIAVLSLVALMGAAASLAQEVPQAAPEVPQAAHVITQPDYSMVNCSGFVTDQKVAEGIRLISGEQSNYKITFTFGDYIYINRGQDEGVRVGDRFPIVRPGEYTKDGARLQGEEELLQVMGR